MKIIDHFRNLVCAWRRWRERQKMMRLLDIMGPRELKDIGITRSDLHAVQSDHFALDLTRRQRG